LKLNINFSNKVSFIGYNLSRIDENNFVVTYYWQCLEEMDKNYSIFVHFTDKNGEALLKKGHRPACEEYQTSEWKKGEIIKESYFLILPDDLQEKDIQIRIGLWHSPKGERLKVLSKEYNDGNDRAIIDELTII